MVICLHCALYGPINRLHVEVWFINTRHRKEALRYWICPACLHSGTRSI